MDIELNKNAPKFFNRELSWLEFNKRVLSEGEDTSVPLLERLKFLAIVSSNFDEFFMVRVAGLKRMERHKNFEKDPSGRTPRQQLEEISFLAHEITVRQYKCLMEDVLPKLKNFGIEYLQPEKYTAQNKQYLENYFRNEVFPLLTPLRATEERCFPRISNLKIYVAFLLKKTKEDGKRTLEEVEKKEKKKDLQKTNEPLAVVQVPSYLSRIIQIPDQEGRFSFALLEDIIELYGTQLFPGYDVVESLIFKVTRDADFSVDEKRDEDFIQAMEEVLENRESSVPVRLVFFGNPGKIIQKLSKSLSLDLSEIYNLSGPVDLSVFSEISNQYGFENLKYPVWKNFWSTELPKEGEFWDLFKEKDIMLNFPYDSYDPVLKFISQAAEDPGVMAIKMTLYRTSGNSPIVKNLERAAQKGKQVTVFIELKARFDEERNISWAQELERAGVIVIYGIQHLKVHAKILLVVRKETNAVVRYTFLATGNFNEKTAKLYSDIGIFTANKEIANDATLFFNIISGYSAIQTMKRLVPSPFDIKKKLLFLIDREITRNETEKNGLICAKMNSLSDPEIIEALYRASNAGVKIKLNVRGICLLVPGIPGQSENIEVVSIIDRFLEHSRIFSFGNGGSTEVFIASADWMPRNLDRRVELMIPVLQTSLKERLSAILETYFLDNFKSHILESNGNWKKKSREGKTYRSQEILYQEAKRLAMAKTKEMRREFIVRRTKE